MRGILKKIKSMEELMAKWYKAFIVCLGLLALATKAESIQKKIELAPNIIKIAD